jgi:hypothetical protein
MGSFAAALGPACFFFFRPMRVVGCGGGSYLGFSFCGRSARAAGLHFTPGIGRLPTLSFLLLSSPGGAPPALDCWLPCESLASWPRVFRREASSP